MTAIRTFHPKQFDKPGDINYLARIETDGYRCEKILLDGKRIRMPNMRPQWVEQFVQEGDWVELDTARPTSKGNKAAPGNT